MIAGIDAATLQVRRFDGPAVLPTLLALATVTSTATKLRLSGVPLGIGELLLVVWLASSVMIKSISNGFSWTGGFALRWGSLFLLATACALLSGAFVAKVLGVTSMYGTAHEAMAWVFVVTLLGWFLLESSSPVAVERFLFSFAAFGTVAAGCLLLGAILSRLLLGSQALWYFGFRLSGWSENPNQLAALLAPLPFLAWYFRSHASSVPRRRLWMVGIVGTVLAGLATQSDALFVAWTLGAGILAAQYWLRAIIGGGRTVRSMVIHGIVMPCLLAAMLVPMGAVLGRVVESAVVGRAGEGGQAGTRVLLWRHGVDAALESPLFGWGPGSHSGLRGAFQATESHNTFIDLATQAGLPSSLALMGLIAVAIYLPLRRRATSLAVAVLSITVLAMFHNVLRQPVFWFTIFGVMAACCGRSATIVSGKDMRA